MERTRRATRSPEEWTSLRNRFVAGGRLPQADGWRQALPPGRSERLVAHGSDATRFEIVEHID
jgi:hypothetical protein